MRKTSEGAFFFLNASAIQTPGQVGDRSAAPNFLHILTCSALFTKKSHSIAESQSSILNTAYKTLLSPVLRAQYILTLEGFPPLETDKLTDSEFIMEVMEAREELEESDTTESVERIRAKNDGKQLCVQFGFKFWLPDILATLRRVYDEIADLIDEKDWNNARDAVVKAKYLEGIEEAAKDRWHALS